ncbi:MAG: class I SAM-dependent methyltransferase [Bacteroidota bacterium]
MYNYFQLASRYFSYYIKASNGKGHGIHSPFVFDFIINVLNDKKHYPAYHVVEGVRQKLINDTSEITVNDFGAGSVTGKNSQRSVSSIAKNAAKPAKYGQLLYRMVQYYKPQTILELGTSLGITTSYMSLAKPGSDVITMEGAPAITSKASENFRDLQLKNIEIVEGNFDTTLASVTDKMKAIDFAFLDGNHRGQPTINYFNRVLAKTNQFSIIVLDDIHWSSDMEEAWSEIKNHSSVKYSIDLFFIGILFFREDFKEQQHFAIRF